MENPIISKAEVTKDMVRLTLSDGVTVDVTVHPGRLHLHFSGMAPDEPGVVIGAFVGQPNVPMLQVANYVDVAYKPKPPCT